MNEIREIYDFGELQIITEKSKLPKYALAKLAYSFARADSRNLNHRTYPEDILSREINKKSEELRTQKIAGQLEHPLSGITRLDKVAHVLNAIWYDKNTKLAGAESFVLDTSKGKDFMTLLDSGLKMGASMRGFGNVLDGKIQSDYKFDTVDFILRPSFGSDATIDQSNIIESANSIFDEKDDKEKNMKDKMMGISEDYVESMLESIYRTQVDEEYFIGSFEDFRKKKEALIRAEILVSHKFFEETEQALEHLGEFEEAKRISSAPVPFVQRKVTPADVYYEAKMAGIDPAVYAEKLNATLEEKEVEPDFTVQEVVSILEEGRKAGIDITNPEEKKRILNIAREQKQKPEALTEEENFIRFAVNKGLNERTAKLLWSKIQKEKKQVAKAQSLFDEKVVAGFGSETRPDARKRSKKIIEGE